MRLATFAAAVCAAVTLAGAPVVAQEVTARKPDSIVATLQAAGYQASLGKDGAGDPMIESRASGHRFRIYFYGCTKGADCSQVQFSAGLITKTKPTMDQVNAWNADKAISKVAVDKEGDPYLYIGVWLKQAVPQAYLRGVIEVWDSSLGSFLKEFQH